MKTNTLHFANKYEARAHIAISLVNNKLLEDSIVADIEIAEKCCNDLYLPDDDLPIQKDNDMWSLDYFYKQIGLVKMTFSKERLEHILEVRKYLRDKGVPELKYTPPQKVILNNNIQQCYKKNDEKSSLPHIRNIIIGGIVVVTIITAAIVLTKILSK